MNPNKNYEKDINKDVDFTALAQDILNKMLDKDDYEKMKFVKSMFEKYKALERSKDGKYTQDWQAYNQAQAKEKIYLMNILNELLGYIKFPETKKAGRNPMSIRDKIFYLTLQPYNEKSSRRCISDLDIAKRLGYVKKAPHFNTLLKGMKDECLIKYFKHIINVSGLPLQHVESDFAVDSSGFSTSLFGRWFDVRFDNKKEIDVRKYVKAHLTCGVKTNVITAVNITKGNRNDSPEFESLVKETDRIFDIREVSADKAYNSRKNVQLVSDLGAIPFIPYKKNVNIKIPKIGKGWKTGKIWKKMYYFYKLYPDEFMHHYHKRSNSESTFHMLKRKFGSHLRSRSETGQTNEVLAKCLCHNLCVLIQEAFEIGIDLNFKKCAEIPIAHITTN